MVTAAQGESRSAMIASWVSQASFKPLGLTIAVAKDRAIESLMQVGRRFSYGASQMFHQAAKTLNPKASIVSPPGP